MERWAHTHFRVFRINRWVLALLVIVALVTALLPMQRLVPAIGSSHAAIRQGVTLLGRDFSGKDEKEARSMLAEMAAQVRAAPVAAHELPYSAGINYVVPEVNGYTLDIDTTLFRLKVADEGSRVEPATSIHPPAKRLADFPKDLIRQGHPAKQAVALLINVDWGTRELTQMLPVLKKRGVQATFFVSGRWAEQNQHLLKMMATDGHEIATHGYDLQNGPTALVRTGKLKGDIARSVAVIQGITGLPVRYYAPHQSEVSKEILDTASELGLHTVLYNVDTVDWRDSTSGERILAVIGQAKSGDFILMHPKPNTAKVLDEALMHLQRNNLRVLRLSDMLSATPSMLPSAGPPTWEG